MRILLRRLSVVLLSATALACASHTTPADGTTPTNSNRNVLTSESMRAQHFETVFDAIQALRSNWLEPRGPDSFRTPSVVLVYMDNTRLGGVETLRAISTGAISKVEHFDAVQATARWGVGHGAGVIYIETLSTRKP